MRLIAHARRELETLPAISAWEKGIKDFAVDMFDSLVEDSKRIWIRNITEDDLLNGAKDWKQYSWGGCALVYNDDIRKALCPDDNGEEKRSRDGKPWLDVQAEALRKAAQLILHCVNDKSEYAPFDGYNRSVALRDEIIFGEYEPEKYLGGIRRFDGLTLDRLEKLVENEYMALCDRQNAAPPVEVFIDFMAKFPGYGVTGFVISIERGDYGMGIDGMEKLDGGCDTMDEMDEFYKLFRKADDFAIGTKAMSCWFD